MPQEEASKYVLFVGLIECSSTLAAKQKAGALHALAPAAEVKGTDAASIAYCSESRLHVYKLSLPKHCLHFRISHDTQVIMVPPDDAPEQCEKGLQ